MARRLEKDALAGAFARGPKPELSFLVPERPKKAQKKKEPEPEPVPAVELPPPEPVLCAPRPLVAEPVPDPVQTTAPFARVLSLPQERGLASEPLRGASWSPAAPPFARLGIRRRIERGWDALLGGLLRGALGWV